VREGKDVWEGRVCSRVLFLERVHVMRGLMSNHGTSTSSYAGVEVESWNVARSVRVSESARREIETRKVAGVKLTVGC
jgi:hypothetical protein